MPVKYHDDGEDTLGPTIATLSLGSPSSMMFRCKKKYSDRKVDRKECLRVLLNHGDMVVMHGIDIHKFYEHKVVPAGLRRFALTSRNIIIDRVKAEEQEDAKSKGTLPLHAQEFEYDGN